MSCAFLTLEHGGWSDYTQWTSWYLNGTASATRTCDNPTPKCGGDDCRGVKAVDQADHDDLEAPVSIRSLNFEMRLGLASCSWIGDGFWSVSEESQMVVMREDPSILALLMHLQKELEYVHASLERGGVCEGSKWQTCQQHRDDGVKIM